MLVEEETQQKSLEVPMTDSGSNSPTGLPISKKGSVNESPKSSKSSSSPKSSKSSSSPKSDNGSETRKKSINQMTLADKDLGELSAPEQELWDLDWDAFKGDVSMKQLINSIDKSIKRRNRLLIAEDEDGSTAFSNFRKQVQKWRPIKMLALGLYVGLPFMEKPGWCI